MAPPLAIHSALPGNRKEVELPIALYDGAYHGFDSPRSRVRQLRSLAFTTGNTGKAHVGTNHIARRKAVAEVLGTLSLD